MERVSLEGLNELTIHNASLSKNNQKYIDNLYELLHRHGHLRRDCQRLINQDRNVFAASMVSAGDADAMITELLDHLVDALTTLPKLSLQKIIKAFYLSMMVSKKELFLSEM